MNRLAALVGGTAAVAAAAAWLPASAQEPSDTTAVRDSTVRLGRVEILADRIPGSVALAPYAVTVRDAAALPRGTPALALDDALRGIPGVQIDNRFNFALGERVSIRGAGARAQFGVRGVRVLIDGIPATLPDGQTTLNQVDLATVDRVEVVRGPVASMFGNAAGGAILIETRSPTEAPWSGEATVTAGSHGLLRTRASAGGAAGGWAYSAGASRVAFEGFRTHSDAENRYATARLRWLGARDLVRLVVNVVDFDARNPGSLSDSLLRVSRYEAFRNNVLQQTGESGTQQQAGVLWRRSIGRDELELSAWTLARDLANPIPARVIEIDRLVTGLRALHRGSRGAVSWTAGVEHEVQGDDRRNFGNDAGTATELVLDQAERVRATGAFGQAALDVTGALRLLAGARYDHSRFSADDHLVTDTDPDDSGARTLAAVSPSAGATLTLPGGMLLYANAGTAFETPTTTEFANRPDGAGGFNPSLEPQRTVSYEVGARRARSTTQLELAVFRSLVRDALIPFEVATVPDRQFFRNAGRTVTSGVEAGASMEPVRWLRVDAAYTYSEARFREYVVDDVSLEGNRIPGIAPHRGELTVTLRPRRGWVAVDARHQSRMAVNDANSAWSPAHTLLDLRAGTQGLRAGAARVTIDGGIRNVFGTLYNASVVVNAFGRRFYEPGPERTFHVGATITLR